MALGMLHSTTSSGGQWCGGGDNVEAERDRTPARTAGRRRLLGQEPVRKERSRSSQPEVASHRTDDHDDVELGRDSAPVAASGTWRRSVSVVKPGEGGNGSSERRDVARGGNVQRGKAEARGGWRGMRSTEARDSGAASAGRLR
jgi:hypothetical protein